MTSREGPRRHAVVGTAGRATGYVRALAFEHQEAGTVVAWCEPDPARAARHDEILREAGCVQPVRYEPDEFSALLDEQRPDVVVVSSPAATRHCYLVPALLAGCDVVVEPPLATGPGPARRIAAAAAGADGEVAVTFGDRYAAGNVRLRRLVRDGDLGTVTAVHLTWLPGPGGTSVHRAGGHVDLVSWWLDDVPQVVRAAAPPSWRGAGAFAAGRLAEAGVRMEVGYRRGTALTWTVSAHAPWEGYRVAVEGTGGRAELDVVARGGVRSGGVQPGLDGAGAAPPGVPGPRVAVRLALRRPGEPVHVLAVPADGADGERGLLDDLLVGGATPDPLGRRAGWRDGLRAAGVALAADRSLATAGDVALGPAGLPLDGP